MLSIPEKNHQTSISPKYNLELHEVTNIFPQMNDHEFEDLKEDIKKNGLHESIWTYQGKIIDGRHRYRACQELGIEPRTREWLGNGSLTGFIVSLNLKRRHLNDDQKAFAALNALPHYEQEAAEHKAKLAAERPRDERGSFVETENKPVTQKIGEMDDRHDSESVERAARDFGTNRQYVADAKKVRAVAPELEEEVINGEISLSDAAKVARLPEEKRKKVTKKVKDEIDKNKNKKSDKKKSSKKSKIKVSDAIRDIKRDETRELAKVIDAPTGKYRTIVIDPPWSAGDVGDCDVSGRSAPAYNVMSLEEIAKLPISDLAEDNCHLYLWTTNRFLPKAFSLLEQWGFKYITLLTWCKPVIGLGSYYRNNTEHVLFAVKGSMLLAKADVGTWFEAERGNHSTKPDKFYEIVESCSPGPRLDMFSRCCREGWKVWGAEV